MTYHVSSGSCGSYPWSQAQLGVVLQTQTRSPLQVYLDLWQHAATLRVSGRPGLILATGIASESEVQ